MSTTTTTKTADTWTPDYSPWRHGGWYVHNVRYPSGACGCVSRNYADRKWRIACDPRPFEEAPTFPNRDAAARAERDLAQELDRVALATIHDRWPDLAGMATTHEIRQFVYEMRDGRPDMADAIDRVLSGHTA